MSLRRTVAAVALLLCAATVVQADPPAGYYDSVDLSSPAALRQSIHDIIDGHTKIPYTASSTDTWDVLEIADQDPFNSSRILDLYQNRTFTKAGGGNTSYNREHTWPNSYGFPDDGSSNLPYTDCHHLFLCDIDYNGARGNLFFDDCTVSCTAYVADLYDGESGVNKRDGDSWETWAGRKGEVARAMFYMDVRYEGDAGSEPDLILTDDAGLIQTSGGSNASVAYMGLLATLLEWHAADPVSDRERARNDVIQQYQGNRNPFIDHPEWVAGVFEGIISDVGDAPAPALIAGIHPNPFNPSTTLSFELPRAGRARVAIYGLDGSLVRLLADDVRDAGPFALTWDGRDDAGRALGSGAFVCRLQSAAGADARPLLLLR